MTRTLALLVFLALALSACPAPEPPVVSTESVAGLVIGNTFDEVPLTIGKGELADKAVVVTYFATW